MRKFLRILIILALAGLAIFIYVKFYFVLGEGVKSGELNYCVKKGYLFKTYEGKLIQTGIRSLSPSRIQSYEFEFSVTNERVAKVLMANSGMEFDLYYKEYNGMIPWRGFSRYVVDSIVSMKDPRTGRLIK